MRSRVACGIERPGTSFNTTEMVAGLNPRCSANVFKLAGLSPSNFSCFLPAIGLRVVGVREGDSSPATLFCASGKIRFLTLNGCQLRERYHIGQQIIVCSRMARQPA